MTDKGSSGPISGSVSESFAGSEEMAVELRLPGGYLHTITLNPSMTAAEFVAACAEHFELHTESWRVAVLSPSGAVELKPSESIREALRAHTASRLYLFPAVAVG